MERNQEEMQINIKLRKETWREFSMLSVWYGKDKKELLQSVLEDYIYNERKERKL